MLKQGYVFECRECNQYFWGTRYGTWDINKSKATWAYCPSCFAKIKKV